MKSKEFRTFFGLGLIALGGLFLLQSLGVIETGLGLLWATLFAAGGATLLYFYRLNQEQWWALIPGFAMIGIGALIGVAEYGPAELENVAGSIFMFSIALSFLIIFLRNREVWWPIIPFGFYDSLGTHHGGGGVRCRDSVPGGCADIWGLRVSTFLQWEDVLGLHTGGGDVGIGGHYLG